MCLPTEKTNDELRSSDEKELFNHSIFLLSNEQGAKLAEEL